MHRWRAEQRGYPSFPVSLATLEYVLAETGQAMITAAVVNVSAPHLNLGACKLAAWLRSWGVRVSEHEGDPGPLRTDQVWLSVIFSWHAPLARTIAMRMKPVADVFCGGPGMFALGNWWQQQTGLPCTTGLDHRFERQAVTFPMTFSSRGCPVGCHFCIVSQREGRTFTLNPNFQPAPVLLDANLSALPVGWQWTIIHRYQEYGVLLKDANSGFEPRWFDEATYHRWKPVLKGPWRCGFDQMGEAPHVERMLRLLRSEPTRKKRVYVLVGNEPMAACVERIRQVIAWGAEPYAQPLLALDTLTRDPIVRFDWTRQRLHDLARWCNRMLWKHVPLYTYRPRQRDPPPFVGW